MLKYNITSVMSLVPACSAMVCVRAAQYIARTVHLPVIHVHPESMAWAVRRARATTFP
jgi:hypothetical protein